MTALSLRRKRQWLRVAKPAFFPPGSRCRLLPGSTLARRYAGANRRQALRMASGRGSVSRLGAACRAETGREVARCGESALGLKRGHSQGRAQAGYPAAAARRHENGGHLGFAWGLSDKQEIVFAESHVIIHQTPAAFGEKT